MYLGIFLGLALVQRGFVNEADLNRHVLAQLKARLADMLSWSSGRVHFDAGASHVCVQVLRDDLLALPREEWRELATLIQSFKK